MSSNAFSFAAVVAVLLCVTVAVAQDDAPPPLPPPPTYQPAESETPKPTASSSPAPPALNVDETLARTLRATAGEPLPISFKDLYAGAINGDFNVVIEQLPVKGRLIAKNSGKPITATKRTAAGNSFFFTSPPTLQESVSFVIGIEQQSSTATTKRYAQITIRVAPARLFARTMTYQTYPGQEKELQLEIRPVRQSVDKLFPSEKATVSPLNRVEITTLPPGCALKQWDNTAIDTVPALVTDPELRLKITPDSTLTTGKRCAFMYHGFNQENQASTDASVILKIVEKRGPFAFGSRMIYRLGVDDARPISLKASPPVAREFVQFYLLTVPTIGKLYLANETVVQALGEPLVVTDPVKGLLVGASTTNYRVVLFYKIDEKEVANVQPADVTFTFKATSANGESEVVTNTISLKRSTAPICGITSYGPVFWDKPVREVRLNYTDPTGHGIDRVVLSQIPQNPIGRLYFRRVIIDGDATEKTGNVYNTIVRNDKPSLVDVGSAFNDRKDGIFYAVLPNNTASRGIDVFTFRVFNQHGESCAGQLVFEVKPHDGKQKQEVVVDPNTGDQQTVEVAIRRETAQAGAFTLLPLWGTANRSITAVSAVIMKLPARGSLFLLSEEAPYEEGRMYRQALGSRPYCQRYDCSKYTGKRLQVGDEVRPVRYGGNIDEGVEPGRPRMFVLFRAPLPKLSLADESLYKVAWNKPDTFEYQFQNSIGTRGITQRVEVYLTRGRLPTITVNYAKKDAWDWTDYNSQRLKAIRVRIVNETELGRKEVMVLKQDLFRRHGRLARFQLFDFGEDGDRIVPVKELKPFVRNNIEGMWVDPQKGAVALIPTINSREQRFTFRVRIFTKNDDGSFNPDQFEDFRVNVVRQNVVPEWDTRMSDKEVSTFTDTVATINLVASDLDGDTLQFKVIRAPKYGVLSYAAMQFLATKEQPVREGALIALPRGSAHTGTTGDVTLQLIYRSYGRVDLQYPVNDTFAVVADDGSGVNSEPWTVKVQVFKNANFGKAAVMTGANSSTGQSATVAAIVAMLIAGVVLVIIVRRRAAKARYMQLPRAGGEAEMGPVKVTAPRVASPAREVVVVSSEVSN